MRRRELRRRRTASSAARPATGTAGTPTPARGRPAGPSTPTTRPRHRRQPGLGQHAVDEPPQVHRLAVRDEVRLARRRRTRRRAGRRRAGGRRRRCRCSHVHLHRPRPMRRSLPARALARIRGIEVRVARAPDQVRAQRDRGEVRAVRGEDRLLGHGLRLGVVRLEVLRVRQRLVRRLRCRRRRGRRSACWCRRACGRRASGTRR